MPFEKSNWRRGLPRLPSVCAIPYSARFFSPRRPFMSLEEFAHGHVQQLRIKRGLAVDEVLEHRVTISLVVVAFEGASYIVRCRIFLRLFSISSTSSYSHPSTVDQAVAPSGRRSTHSGSMTTSVGWGSNDVCLRLADAVCSA